MSKAVRGEKRAKKLAGKLRWSSGLDGVASPVGASSRGAVSLAAAKAALHAALNPTALKSLDFAAYRLDDEKVANYIRLFRELGDRFGVGGTPDLATITRYNDIIVRAESEELPAEIDPGEIRAIFQAALSASPTPELSPRAPNGATRWARSPARRSSRSWSTR